MTIFMKLLYICLPVGNYLNEDAETNSGQNCCLPKDIPIDDTENIVEVKNGETNSGRNDNGCLSKEYVDVEGSSYSGRLLGVLGRENPEDKVNRESKIESKEAVKRTHKALQVQLHVKQRLKANRERKVKMQKRK
ncbi:hypothetical protein EZV62_005411 [Acer yangbiense]|uniref:Uncharacterized protein n=1 Tax=Acer yangbiense TaxID=1000413 RepID=A0A5C7IPR2_9ROSI|nr:hypothetical protein EZV62_005411 [Acer yangbiense]